MDIRARGLPSGVGEESRIGDSGAQAQVIRLLARICIISGMDIYAKCTAQNATHIVCVGQLSCDTVVVLDHSLVVGGQAWGRAASSLGGTAAIVAFNMAVLGGVPRFCGHIGCSPEDGRVAADLAAAGVKIAGTVVTPHGLRVVIAVDPSGERTMIASGDMPDWELLDVPVRAGDVVFFEGWHLADSTSRVAYSALIQRAHDAGAFVALDVCTANGANDGYAQALALAPIDLVLANHVEADALGLLSSPPAPTVVVHHGADATVVLHAGRMRRFPVDAVTPIDTSGAGDTFTAGFLLALSRGGGVDDAVACGHAAARRVVQVVGTLLPTPSQPAVPGELVTV